MENHQAKMSNKEASELGQSKVIGFNQSWQGFYQDQIKHNQFNRGKSLFIVPTFNFFWKIAPRANKELTTTTNFKA